jgi:hypothetical protein
MNKQQASPYTYQSSLIAALLVTLFLGNTGHTFQRYKNNAEDDGSNCSECHGDFTKSTSPKSTVFPSGNKHEMHRHSSYMNSDCGLCHSDKDSHNPYLGSSDGASNNPGLGCNGCHLAEGLRAHHAAHDVAICAFCHSSDGPPPPENTIPPYYGTADTKVDSPCNGVAVANTNENWSVGDFLGLDNDGDTLYDMADFACGPYQIVGITRNASTVTIAWETAGGRTDRLVTSPNVAGPYTNASPTLAIPGVGVVITNVVAAAGATGEKQFYRIRYEP